MRSLRPIDRISNSPVKLHIASARLLNVNGGFRPAAAVNPLLVFGVHLRPYVRSRGSPSFFSQLSNGPQILSLPYLPPSLQVLGFYLADRLSLAGSLADDIGVVPLDLPLCAGSSLAGLARRFFLAYLRPSHVMYLI